MTILEIALPTPLRRLFDYLPPESATASDIASLSAGYRIKVQFGKQELVGILIRVKPTTDIPINKLRAALAIVDSTPCLPADLLSLCQFTADYYQSPWGEVLNTALPTLLRQGKDAAPVPQQAYRLTLTGKGLPVGALKRAAKQAELLYRFQSSDYLTKPELDNAGISRTALKALIDKELVEAFFLTPDSSPAISGELREAPLTLNDEQERAFNAIPESGFSVSLIDGVTGSGKTEIYLQAIESQLLQGRQALVLVPEIGLTPQTLSRFARRFKTPLAAIHSGLNDRERLDAWLAAKSGQAGIVIGTRSALFTPLHRLGIIIIDEEHDLSFKQQDGVRYSARDLAVVRAQLNDVPLVLGSATPSLETLYKAQQGRYQYLPLTQRAGNAQAPHLKLIDTRNSPLHQGFAATSLKAIHHTLEQGNQVLVFLNRRGYAPSIECQQCGWFAECRHCDMRFTLHQTPYALHCHYCDSQMRVPTSCPSCHSRQLSPVGQGTERSEETLTQLFPKTPVIRVDRDSTRGREGLAQLLSRVNSGEPCILVGTQMLAKGHHFPDVTLVVVLDADTGLFSTDFRGTERMAQLLLQVAGRAGREQKPGEVYIQTHHADHPILQTLTLHGYPQLAQEILRERQLTFMPPFRHLALIRMESPDIAKAVDQLRQVRQWLETQMPSTPELSYLGPLPALMEKRGDRFRYQLQINTANRKLLQPLLKAAALHLEKTVRPPLRWHIDVDPQEM
ncbi:MAG: primosomal protein N' [Cellvibrio sp.]